MPRLSAAVRQPAFAWEPTQIYYGTVDFAKEFSIEIGNGHYLYYTPSNRTIETSYHVYETLQGGQLYVFTPYYDFGESGTIDAKYIALGDVQAILDGQSARFCCQHFIYGYG